MSDYNICPSTEKAWETEAAARFIGPLHDAEKLSSASKLGVNQYLMLKTVWKLHRNINSLADDWASSFGATSDGIIAARKKLNEQDAWKYYLAELP